MSSRIISIGIALLLGVTLAPAQSVDDHELIVQAAAQRESSPAAPPQPQSAQAPARATDELVEVEQRARADVGFAQARLELVLARKALQAHSFQEAAQRAQRSLRMLARLPARIDRTEYELQAEGILARAARAGVTLDARDDDPNASPLDPQPAPPPNGSDDLESRLQAASRIARAYSGADTPEVDTRGDVADLAERTLRNQTPDDAGYRPGREVIDVGAILHRDRQRLYYQDALREAYQADEARRLTEVDEARVAGEGVVQYPDNWPEIVAKRAKYKNGLIARSPSRFDSEGREWYTAIYDIHDLIYVPPDFYPVQGLSLTESLRNELDREALRWRSEIFNGWPRDLAAGIPLLRFFGGVDDFAFRGPKYSLERQQQIVEMIKAYVPQPPEARIIAIPPIQP